MNKIVNTRLLSHPVNWLVVWSMLFMLWYVIHLLTSYVQGRHPGAPPASSSENIAGPGTDTPENVFA